MRVLKWLGLALLLGLVTGWCSAQNTTVTGTIVDPSSQVWSGATVTSVFTPTPNFTGKYSWNSQTMTTFPQVVATANGSGVFTMSVPDSSQIVPAGSKRFFIICPLSGAVCSQTTSIPTSGATLDISSLISQTITTPQLNPTFIQYGYNDAEMLPSPGVGQMYYRTTDGQLRQWNGSAWVNAGGGGGGSGNVVASPQGIIAGYLQPGSVATVQGSTTTGTLLNLGTPILRGELDTDLFATGANTGVGNAFNNGNCQPLDCLLYRPSTSPDTGGPGVTITPSKSSYYMIDMSHGQHNEAFANPGLQPDLNGGTGNIGQFTFGFISQTSQGTVQGNVQSATDELIVSASPGFVNAGDGSSPAAPGFSSVGQWAIQPLHHYNITINSAGIGTAFNKAIIFAGIGDKSVDTVFMGIEGGVDVPSDEGIYLHNSHIYNNGDMNGTVTSIVDGLHLKTNPTGWTGTQGVGRYLLATNRALNSIDTIHEVNPPGTFFPVGTVVFDNATFPASTAYGTVTGSCTVNQQEGTVATATGCQLLVTGGTTGVVVPTTGASNMVCMGQNLGGSFVLGAQVISATGGSGVGTTYTANISMARTIRSNPATNPVTVGYWFQGGACSDAVVFVADNQNYGGDTGNVYGSAFALLGSYDTHTLAYFQPGGSQTWQLIPQHGSFSKTTNTVGQNPGAVPLTNLQSSGGVATANFFQQNNNQDFINGQTSGMVIAGCSDSALNGTIVGATGLQGPGIISWPASGTHSCPTATMISAAAASAFVFPIAQILDVRDPNAGYAVDGYFTHSYQPTFQVGDTLDVPPFSSSTFTVNHEFVELSQPCGISNISCNGYAVLMNLDSAYHGTAYYANNSSWQTTYRTNGLGGFAQPGNFAYADGLWSDLLATPYIPMHSRYAINLGSAPFGMPAPYQNFNIIGVETNTGTETDLFYDLGGEYYGPAHSTGFRNNQATYGGHGTFLGEELLITPTYLTSYLPHNFNATAEFTDIISTQFRDMLALNNGGGIPINTQWAFDNVIPSLTLTTAGTPGSTPQAYIMAVNFPMGVSFSPITQIPTGPATLNGTNYIQIACSTIPTGAIAVAGVTATVYNATTNPLFKTVGTCANSSSSPVNDQGTYGTVHINGALSAGAAMYAGGFVASGTRGAYCWTQSNIFNDSSDPTIPRDCISQSGGVFSLDTSQTPNGLGSLTLFNLNFGGTITGTGPGPALAQLPPTIYSTLNAAQPCSTSVGTIAAVSDSSTQTWGATYTGGGALYAIVTCDGTNYTVMGK